MGELNWRDLAVVSIRASALVAELVGKTAVATALFKTADRIEAGENVDSYMGDIAKLLKERQVNPQDWADVYEKIAAADARLDSDAPAGVSEGSGG